ncbi:4-hydroxybenzoate 3-monooxygenase [Gordonia polyisoprenivorans]|uniref:4-hydroxybenzoate 3-monooxygenase n=1 Tax=Gordonia polyisoprenivorans TaxID=84595 RepID=UPI0023002B84|nr:4-hydroxybenzoate 3-monooxygenase [Gordonia polyisoprenivorans]WCB36552.1 4-hydroxybenzoate 3-monooxygenase [Gordonia polyisoprenivorans]
MPRSPLIRCQVAIIGAGPAGLSLAMMLHRQGIDAVVLEARDEAHVRARVRAGVIEQTTVDTLTELGVADRLHVQALRHNGFYLRYDRHTHHLDFHRLTGRNAFVYGQAEIVADLIDARTAAGLPLVFDAADVEIGPTDGPTTEVTYTVDGRTHRLTADFVAGCDGFHGVSRTRLPSSVRTIERVYPFAWLGILARTTPVTEEGMYCAHPDGLSVHSMRGTHITRQYLQVPADTDLADWPDERIWAELRRRSASDDHPELQTGEIFDRSLAPLRSVVTERMQHGSLFLLGDAAHIVPPTGAKGLNLAVSDASVLSHALGVFYRDGDRTRLESYTDTALPRIWQAQNFSWTLTSVLHRFTDDPFDWGLRHAKLTRWVASRAEQQALGEVYLGLPFPTPWRPE